MAKFIWTALIDVRMKAKATKKRTAMTNFFLEAA